MNAKTYSMNKKQAGFTLIEVMIALVVAAIVMSIATPSFITMTQNNRIATQTNDLVTSLSLARSEAVKRGLRVTVCKSTDNANCIATGGWHQGWITFVDADNDAAVDEGEILIRAHGPIGGGNTFNGTGNTANYISYVSSGFSQLTSGGLQSGEIILCDSRGFGATARALVLSASGQIRTAKANDATVTATAC